MEKRPQGRPTKYLPEMDDAIRAAADSGALGACTVNEVAKVLNVYPRTIYEWLAVHESFSQAFAYARRSADKQIESALFKRAKGYELTDVRKTVKDGPKGTEVTESTQITHIPADVPAAVFWLKNRNRDEWSDKQQVEVTGDFFEHVEKIVKGEA